MMNQFSEIMKNYNNSIRELNKGIRNSFSHDISKIVKHDVLDSFREARKSQLESIRNISNPIKELSKSLSVTPLSITNDIIKATQLSINPSVDMSEITNFNQNLAKSLAATRSDSIKVILDSLKVSLPDSFLFSQEIIRELNLRKNETQKTIEELSIQLETVSLNTKEALKNLEDIVGKESDSSSFEAIISWIEENYVEVKDGFSKRLLATIIYIYLGYFIPNLINDFNSKSECITRKGCRIREQGTTQSRVVQAIPEGSPVEITLDEGKWKKVKWKNTRGEVIEGWIYCSLLRKRATF